MKKKDDQTDRTIINRIADMPSIYRKGYISVVAGKASPRNAIKAFCLECMGWKRSEVSKCNTVACPLNLYRPYRKAGDDD